MTAHRGGANRRDPASAQEARRHRPQGLHAPLRRLDRGTRRRRRPRRARCLCLQRRRRAQGQGAAAVEETGQAAGRGI